MTTFRCLALALFLAAPIAAAACTEAGAPGANETPTTSQPASPPADQAASASSSPPPATINDLFPPGAGREPVLNNCASCHNLACSTIGQRTAARWDALKESHKEKVSDADLEATFAYLKANFNDSKPEPKVPPQFLQGGCTPF
jgi:mono/diheme cytochrome c family protein